MRTIIYMANKILGLCILSLPISFIIFSSHQFRTTCLYQGLFLQSTTHYIPHASTSHKPNTKTKTNTPTVDGSEIQHHPPGIYIKLLLNNRDIYTKKSTWVSWSYRKFLVEPSKPPGGKRHWRPSHPPRGQGQRPPQGWGRSVTRLGGLQRNQAIGLKMCKLGKGMLGNSSPKTCARLSETGGFYKGGLFN